MVDKPKVILDDGNAFAIMSSVSKALRDSGLGDKVEKYKKKAMAGDYDNLLRVTMDYADIRIAPSKQDLIKEWEEEE